MEDPVKQRTATSLQNGRMANENRLRWGSIDYGPVRIDQWLLFINLNCDFFVYAVTKKSSFWELYCRKKWSIELLVLSFICRTMRWATFWLNEELKGNSWKEGLKKKHQFYRVMLENPVLLITWSWFVFHKGSAVNVERREGCRGQWFLDKCCSTAA